MKSNPNLPSHPHVDESLLARQHEQTTLTSRPTFRRREWVVMLVVAFLAAAILISASQRGRRSRYQTGCASHQGRLGEAMLMYAANHDGELPSRGGHGAAWLSGAPSANPSFGVVSSSRSLMELMTEGYLSDTHVFRCPAAGGRGFIHQPGMAEFPPDAVVGYSYQYALGGGLRIRGGREDRGISTVPVLADASPLFGSDGFDAAQIGRNSTNHGRDGQNVLYLSGDVRWARDVHAGMAGDDIYTVRGKANYDGHEQPADADDTFLLPAMPQK